MKLLWLATHVNPNFGGLELHSISFVKALKDRFDIGLVLSKDNYIDKNIEGFKKYYTTTKYSFDLKALKDVYNYTRDFNPDVIICNNAKEYEITLTVSKLLRKKSIAFRHMEHLKNKLVAKYILSNMDIVYVVSEKLRDELISKGVNPDKTKVLYNPIPVGNPKKISSDKIRLLFVGKIISSKGIWEFVYVAKELLKSSKNFSFDVVGDGEELIKIKDYVKKEGIDGFFNFHGFQKDTYKFYQNADMVLVLTKTDEAISRVGIEALANGCVVIGSRVGGIKETIKEYENGIVVEPTDIPSIKDAVMYFSNKDILLKAQKLSYELYKEKFSQERILKTFEEDMKQLSK